MNKKILIIYLVTVVFSLLATNIYSITEYDEKIDQYNGLVQKHNNLINKSDPSYFDERCPMFDKEGNFKYYENSNVNGLYFPNDDYYVVWTKDRTINETEATDKHEYCHYLIDNDYKHFCEE